MIGVYSHVCICKDLKIASESRINEIWEFGFLEVV